MFVSGVSTSLKREKRAIQSSGRSLKRIFVEQISVKNHYEIFKTIESQQIFKRKKFDTQTKVDIIFDLELLQPFLVFIRPFINRSASKPYPSTTTKLPLFNIELAETVLFLPYKKATNESDTLCLSIDRLVLTPR